MTLGEAAAAFNRYNNRKIRILDASAASLRIGGVFDTDNVDGFARLLQSRLGLTVHEGREEITVASAGGVSNKALEGDGARSSER